MDYKTVKEYLGDKLYSNIICKNMPLSMQADAIRVALLRKYGGLWMDIDTIILNGNFTKLFERYELTMIGEEKYRNQYIGFIFASRNSKILNLWLSHIINKVSEYKYFFNRNVSNSSKKNITFDYLGNSIINPLLRNNTNRNYLRVDSKRINAFPERIFIQNISQTNVEKYRQFYFSKGVPNRILNSTKYVILLHNSWTPFKYKNITEEEFLKQDILISKLFAQILKK